MRLISVLGEEAVNGVMGDIRMGKREERIGKI